MTDVPQFDFDRPPSIPTQDPIDPATFATASTVFMYALSPELGRPVQAQLARLDNPTDLYRATARRVIDGATRAELPSDAETNDRWEANHHQNVFKLLFSLHRRMFVGAVSIADTDIDGYLRLSGDEYFGRQWQGAQFERIRLLTEAASTSEDLLNVTQAYNIIRYLARDTSAIGGRLMQPNELSKLLLKSAETKKKKRGLATVESILELSEPSVRVMLNDTNLRSIFGEGEEGGLDQRVMSGLIKNGQTTQAYEAGLRLLARFIAEGNTIAANVVRIHLASRS